MDNRVFDINGQGKQMLADVLRLALWQRWGCYDSEHETGKASGYGY